VSGPLDLRRLVAGNVRAEIAKKRISVVALAGFAEVSTAQLYDVLRCRKGPSLDFVAKLAAALEVEPWQLLRPQTARGKARTDLR
jgi:transcriptional regulator with XRE-family HTH domain